MTDDTPPAMADPTTADPGRSPDSAGKDALIAALIDLERHIDQRGWDQPPRLFALVDTDSLIAAEPQLAESLGLRSSADTGLPGALTAVEQDDFSGGADLVGDLAGIAWPESVFGCAVSFVRTFLPTGFEADIPEDATAAAAYVAGHEKREEIRVVVGVDRADHRHGVARLVSQPGELLGAEDLVPGLAEVLAHTLA
ncbi:PPA1309 family protein [Microlunatus panaciterrae]|uniref:Uncharacterized protein n=1 Tax=Microlunatus panaciterrae TaxID=400768 RepID=A0ABS2REQ0_9ACTN|nr:PPA1309 family protein [Microlunatus panaciterrae]MBM7797481.1 hypothetical protein [Microlunatus panaciterrae]